MVKRPIFSRKAMKKLLRRHAVTALAALLVSQNVVVSLAEVTRSTVETKDETKKEADEENLEPDEKLGEKEDEDLNEDEDLKDEEVDDENVGDKKEDEKEAEEEDEEETSKNLPKASPSELEEPDSKNDDEELLEDDVENTEETEKDIFEDMPEIGSSEFTKWFFDHVDSEALWNWVIELMEAVDVDEENEAATVFMDWYEKNEEKVNKAYEEYFGVALFAANSSVGDLWTGWQGNTSWSGDGTEESPYEISDLSDLAGLSEMVAAGSVPEGTYFVLTNDIEIGNLNKSWNPIGWYENASDLGGTVRHKFTGHFDGAGHTISGLKVVDTAHDLNNVGLFGAVDGGSIKNLTVESDSGVHGADNVGILAGSIEGDTIV